MNKLHLVFVVCIMTLGVNNYTLADEVKSFDTPEDQQSYLSEVIARLPETSIMSEKEARETLKTKEEVSKWVNKMGLRGQFVITGKLVDEQDHLLDDVSVNIQKRASGFWKSKQTSSDCFISRYFVILVDQCDSVDLSFNKTGYVSPVYYLSYSLKHDGKQTKEDETRDIVRRNNLLLAENQKVLLLKQGEFLKLEKFTGVLKFDNKKERNEIFLLKSWVKSWEDNNIQEPYFKIEYKRDKNGKILTVNKNFGFEGQLIIPKYVSFELVSRNPNDGIFLIENPNIPSGRFLSTMGYAISGDYIKTFPLPFKLGGYCVHFYYFVNNKYGKCSYETNSNRITIFQNNENDPAKKRNLWTKQ